MKYTTRKYVKTIVTYNELTLVDKKPQLSEPMEITLNGVITDIDKIQKEIRAINNDNKIYVVIDTKQEEELRGMTLEDFYKYSVPMADYRTPVFKGDVQA